MEKTVFQEQLKKSREKGGDPESWGWKKGGLGWGKQKLLKRSLGKRQKAGPAGEKEKKKGKLFVIGIIRVNIKKTNHPGGA